MLVWQKSMHLVEELYVATKCLPKEEMFGLRSQITRAAVSIPSNIAEGQKRGTRKDFAQFLRIASGSAAELETQIILASNIYRVKDFDCVRELLTEVQKILAALNRSMTTQ